MIVVNAENPIKLNSLHMMCAECYEEEHERIVGLDLEDALLKLIYNTLQN